MFLYESLLLLSMFLLLLSREGYEEKGMFQECSESGSRNITKAVFVVGLITGQLRPSRKDPPVRRQHLRCGFCKRRQGAGKGREGKGRGESQKMR